MSDLNGQRIQRRLGDDWSGPSREEIRSNGQPIPLHEVRMGFSPANNGFPSEAEDSSAANMDGGEWNPPYSGSQIPKRS